MGAVVLVNVSLSADGHQMICCYYLLLYIAYLLMHVHWANFMSEYFAIGVCALICIDVHSDVR